MQLSVHNTGSYIPAAGRGRSIFDRFFQVDPGQARANGNTGLGLAITREIVEAHGGHVEVSSSETEGTEFTITLPRTHRDDPSVWAPPSLREEKVADV